MLPDDSDFGNKDGFCLTRDANVAIDDLRYLQYTDNFDLLQYHKLCLLYYLSILGLNVATMHNTCYFGDLKPRQIKFLKAKNVDDGIGMVRWRKLLLLRVFNPIVKHSARFLSKVAAEVPRADKVWPSCWKNRTFCCWLQISVFIREDFIFFTQIMKSDNDVSHIVCPLGENMTCILVWFAVQSYVPFRNGIRWSQIDNWLWYLDCHTRVRWFHARV